MKSVKEQFNEWFKDNREYLRKKFKKEDIWVDILDEFIGCDFELDYYKTARDFQINDRDVFDLEGLETRSYRNSYIWCLYAIVWGIKKYHTKMIADNHESANDIKEFYKMN